MPDDLPKLITDLKTAIHHSMICDNVIDALAALEGHGHKVNVALEVTLNPERSQESLDEEEGPAIAERRLEFTPTDAQFLRSLRIAV